MYSLTPYPLTPIGNFFGFILALLPLLSNIRKLSLAIWAYAIWIAIHDLITFVNTIIWHNNVNIVAPVWCDIATKLQSGADIGTRTCTLVISIHLFKITRLQGPLESTKKQKRNTMIYELAMTVGFPVIYMALLIIVQPDRFEILEEIGCEFAEYSYVGYITMYVPQLASSIGCAILAPLTIRTFWQHRKEMNEFLSSGRDMTRNKYYRLMVIACLDTFYNLPVLIVIIATDIARGKEDGLNYPYISWKNVHDGAGGNLPGISLSTIVQIPASVWSTDNWVVFTLKWNEWIYVLHAITFFTIFGTTPEMRNHYRSAIWFVPKRFGCQRQPVSGVETISDVAYDLNAGQQTGDRPAVNRRRGSLSFLETTIASGSATHSREIGRTSDVEATVSRFAQAIEVTTIEEQSEKGS